MDNDKFTKYLLIMFVCFVIDSVLRYYLPHDILKTGLTIVSYVGIIMFTLLNNTINEKRRYLFALVCGVYYTIIYGDGVTIYALLFIIYAFIGKEYMKQATYTYFEAFAIVFLTIFLQETVVYLLMWMNGTTHLAISTFVVYRLLPTMLVNILIFNVVNYVHNKLENEGGRNVYFG